MHFAYALLRVDADICRLSLIRLFFFFYAITLMPMPLRCRYAAALLRQPESVSHKFTLHNTSYAALLSLHLCC